MARRDLDDDAPWLAEASPRAETHVTRASFFWTAAILLGLAAVVAIGLVLLLSKKNAGSTQGYMEAEQAPVITAEPGPYKIPPVDPKGMQVEGQDQTIYAAGEGIDAGSVIDQSAMPEAVLPRPGTAPPPGLPEDLVPPMQAAPTVNAPGAAPPKLVLPPPATRPAAIPPALAPKTTAPAAIAVAKPPIAAPAATPKPAAATPKIVELPAKKPSSVQLGAFSSPEKADAAWAALAGKPGIAGFGKRVIKIESNGQTLYRLRASGGDAAALCASLKAAGRACAVVE
ncbi:SPOR domain-containing protein [Sandarakinorhabdus sp. DWP1-3-1]|uniref:SPOR domain-containing protein n=1 Tax=Sandarakinorhabdus sp. DWP1-3-1 TaxID=2804627 RepID=UPI003CF4CAF5